MGLMLVVITGCKSTRRLQISKMCERMGLGGGGALSKRLEGHLADSWPRGNVLLTPPSMPMKIPEVKQIPTHQEVLSRWRVAWESRLSQKQDTRLGAHSLLGKWEERTCCRDLG